MMVVQPIQTMIVATVTRRTSTSGCTIHVATQVQTATPHNRSIKMMFPLQIRRMETLEGITGYSGRGNYVEIQ